MSALTDASTTPVTRAIAESIEAWRPRVDALARALHADPEIAFAEHRSAAAIMALLAEGGFEVTPGVGGLDTAFDARIGSGDLTVAVCVEYDALPEIGHACGHHLIAGASVAAALALAPLVDELGITLRAIGTPAEEHGGGKAVLLEEGVFDGVSICVMLHPVQDGVTYNPVGTSAQAVGRYRAIFTGRSAHAAAAPHLAINAADAAVLAQVAIGLLRQQTRGDERIGLVTREAGSVTNIIPDRAVIDFECRAFEMDAYHALHERVRQCFIGAATATGTDVEITATEPLYEPLLQHGRLAASWVDAADALGLDTSPSAGMSGGSTDMGNLSQVIPSLHPWFSLPGVDAPIHSHDFARLADQDTAYEAMFVGATALAWTVADAATGDADREHFLRAAYRR